MALLLAFFGGKRGFGVAAFLLIVALVLGIAFGIHTANLKRQISSLKTDLTACKTESARLTGELRTQNSKIAELNRASVEAKKLLDEKQKALDKKQEPIIKIIKESSGQRISKCEEAMPKVRKILEEMRKAE